VPFSPKQSPQLKIVLILYSPSDLDRTQRFLNSRGNLQTPPRYLQDFLLSSLHQGIPDGYLSSTKARNFNTENYTFPAAVPFSLSYLGGFTAFFSRSIPPKGFTAAVAATVEGAAAWVWAFGCPFRNCGFQIRLSHPGDACGVMCTGGADAGGCWRTVRIGGEKNLKLDLKSNYPATTSTVPLPR